jgi:hypothetical protein
LQGVILKIGRPDGWWNSKVPIGRMILVAGVFLAGLFVWGAFGDLIGSVVWGIRHQHTASFRGQTLQLPWFWREEEWINYNEFELNRSYGRLAIPSSVTVRYENIAPEDIQKRIEIMKSDFAGVVKVSGWFDDDYEGDAFTKTRYVCHEKGYTWSPVLIVNCFSRDGRWSVDMLGSRQTRLEFEMILRGVASMGDPTK